MGKATILSGGDEGSYTIKIDTGKAAQTARLAKLDARLTELATLIDEADTPLLISDALLSARQAEVDGTIAAYVAATRAEGATPASIQPALDAYLKATQKLNAERVINGPLLLRVQMLRSELTQLTKDRAAWAALKLEVTQQAWCADLTEDAGGEVATIEIPGEDKLVLIAPAAPPPVPATDGVLTAREVQTPEQVFFNAAILPGWQKWKPTYRRGIITALDYEADTADVTLLDDVSSAQGLGINQTPTLTGVPVEYMQCDAEAFEVGDRCVVRFTGMDWAHPKVIGFCDHPKSCGVDLNYIYPDLTNSMAMSAHITKVKIGKDGPEVSPPAVWGEVTHGKWWRWDDGVVARVRKDLDVQAAKTVSAQYCSMARLYRSIVRLSDTWVDGSVLATLTLSQISDDGSFAPSGHYSHEVLAQRFATSTLAEAWRPTPVAVRRWVPALDTTFVMSYEYNAAQDKWLPPEDFAAGSFGGMYTP